MMGLTQCRQIDTIHLVRAIAIALVVTNHTLLRIPLHAGLNLLIIASGISFAQMAFRGDTKGTIIAAISFLRVIVLGSLALCMFWFVLLQKSDPLELAMISNWFYRDRISLFPIWYTQALLQLMVILSLVFWVFDLTPKLRKSPTLVTGLLLTAAVSLTVLSKEFWDTRYLSDKLPHLIGWMFILGWLYWALFVAQPATTRNRVIFSALSCVLFYVLVKKLNLQDRAPHLSLVLPPLLLLVWAPRLRLPWIVTHLTYLVSQATIFLFFFHGPLILFMRKVTVYIGLGGAPGAILRLIVVLSVPVLLWALYMAMRRVLLQLRDESALPPLRPLVGDALQ